jgi:hypothetical protein
VLKKTQQETGLNKNQIRQIVSFLREYNLIVVDETGEKIKLEETVRKFLTQTATS